MCARAFARSLVRSFVNNVSCVHTRPYNTGKQTERGVHARAFTGDRSPRVDTKWPQSRRSAAHGEIVARRDRERRTASIVIDRSILVAEDARDPHREPRKKTLVYGRLGSIRTEGTPRKDSYRLIAILIQLVDRRTVSFTITGTQRSARLSSNPNRFILFPREFFERICVV